MVAISGIAIIGLALATIVALAFVGGLLWTILQRRGAAKPDIPPAMRPGPADETLERRMTQRHMGWSMLFVLFFATWLPIVWLREPNTNVSDEVELVERSVERGERWFGESDEENPTGFGCARCHGAEAQGGTTAFVPDEGEPIPDYPVPSLRDVCGRMQIETVDEDGQVKQGIRDTIMRGRPGTPMPSWSIRYEGPMNDQQIKDLVNYLVSIQELPEGTPNLCRNPQAAQESPSPGPTPAGGAAGGAQTSPSPPAPQPQSSPGEAPGS